jgi:hypothetical protein
MKLNVANCGRFMPEIAVCNHWNYWHHDGSEVNETSALIYLGHSVKFSSAV